MLKKFYNHSFRHHFEESYEEAHKKLNSNKLLAGKGKKDLTILWRLS